MFLPSLNGFPSFQELIVGAVMALSLIISAILWSLYISERKSVFKQSGMVFLALGISSFGILCFIYTPALDHKEVPMLKEMGNKMIEQIENYKLLNGRYPITLQEVHIDPPRTRYGAWRYRMWEDKGTFEISVGHYANNGFSLSWNTQYNDWYLDT